jgi:hypothetical protein
MTGAALIVIAALIAIFVIGVVVPGGVFVVPVLVLALIAYGIYRYTQARRGVL